MLHILFFILKILAIILACILGLLVFLLLVVLFVPIRYRVDLIKREEFIVKARANWLLRIVFVRAWFINQQLHLILRVFGICIYDNLRPEKEKKPEKSSPSLKETKYNRHKKRKKNQGKEISINTEHTNNQVNEINTDVNTSIKTEHKSEHKTDNKAEVQKIEVQKIEEHKIEENKIEEPIVEVQKVEVQRIKDQKVEVQRIEVQVKTDNKVEDLKVEVQKVQDQIKTETLETQKTESQETETHIKIPVQVTEDTTEDAFRDESEENVNKIPNKLKAFFMKLHRIGRKIADVLINIKAKVKKLVHSIKDLWVKKNKIMDFLKDEIHKAGIKMVFHQIMEVLKHCAPQKISGYIRYGTGDPCSTGEAFAVAAFFYGKYGKSLVIEPDFEEEVLEAEVMVKGRIRIFTLLIIGIRLIRDKNFKKLLKNAKQLKEEL